MKVTVPVGVPAPVATVIVAVNVTEFPKIEGDPLVATLEVVVPLLTF